MGWYIVVKTINGHRYRYYQRTWRVGRHIRCENIYIGRADGKPLRRAKGMAGRTSSPTSDHATLPAPDSPLLRDAERGRVASGPLRLEGEEAFIASLLDETGLDSAVTWQPGYVWTACRLSRPLEVDPEILRLPLRLGVTMRSVVYKGREIGAPNFNPFGKRRSTSDGLPLQYGRVIEMPDPSRWRGACGVSAERAYIGTLLHEVVHATLTALGRPESAQGWSPAYRTRLYAVEEIIAELGANIIARRLGIEREDSSMSRNYIRSWRRHISKELQDEDLKRAVRQAKEAADYVLAHHARGGFGVTTTPSRIVTVGRAAASPLRQTEPGEHSVWQVIASENVASQADQDVQQDVPETRELDNLRVFHGRSARAVLESRGLVTPERQATWAEMTRTGAEGRVAAEMQALAEETLRAEGYAGVHWRGEGETPRAIYHIWDESCLRASGS